MTGDGRPETVILGRVMELFLGDSGAALERTNRFDLSYAGAETPVAVALTRLGMRATFVGRVGADPLGARIARASVSVGHEALQTLGIDTDPDAWFAKRGAHTVVVRFGAIGAEESGPDGRHRVAGHEVVEVDPVAATHGDTSGLPDRPAVEALERNRAGTVDR